MKEKEDSQISEKEKVNNWLEKQILIWNGAQVNKLSGKNRVGHLSSNIKIEKNDAVITKKYSKIKDLDSSEKKTVKQDNSVNTNNKTENNQNSPNSNVRLKFKDWSDLHNYLLISMRQE